MDCLRLGRRFKKIYDICIENIIITYLCIMSNAEIITSFSKNLFWDVDPGSINLESNSRYIIQRVLEYGRYNDWKLILSPFLRLCASCFSNSVYSFAVLSFSSPTFPSTRLEYLFIF